MHILGKNRTETLKVVEKYTKMVDPFLLDGAYRETASMQEIPWPMEKLILAALRAHKMEDKLSPDSIRDDSLLRELREEGSLDAWKSVGLRRGRRREEEVCLMKKEESEIQGRIGIH